MRAVGKIAAQMVQELSRVDVMVGDAVATVLVAEGCAQLIWHRGAPRPLAGHALMNDFVTPDMAAQLRVLADRVEAAQALLGQHGKGAVK